MTEPNRSTSALLIIDNQRAFSHPTHWGPARSNPHYEQNLSDLVQVSRSAGLFIIHVKHMSTTAGSPLQPDTPAPANHPLGGLGVDFNENSIPLKSGVEPIVEKNVNSAFIGTNLEEMIRARKMNTLYLCGLTTDHCVSTTTRMAGNLHVCDVKVDGVVKPGRIVLIGDATACWKKPDGEFDAETVHSVHLESLREFAEIQSTVQVLDDIRTS